jgi:gliding motility-associated-like protein
MRFDIKNQLHLLFCCIFLLVNLASKAQLNTPNVIASGDMLSQGFQQPDYEVESDVIEPEFFIPNGFSPNGDGFNDTWDIPYLNQYPDSKVKVFNRWGQELYSSNGNSNPWNGTFNGKDLPTADYYYIIVIDQLEKKLTGTVTLKK